MHRIIKLIVTHILIFLLAFLGFQGYKKYKVLKIKHLLEKISSISSKKESLNAALFLVIPFLLYIIQNIPVFYFLTLS